MDGESKKREKSQMLLGGKGDEIVDDQQVECEPDEGFSIGDDPASTEMGGVSITVKGIQDLTLSPPPIRKPIVRCRFHGGVVAYKVGCIPQSQCFNHSALLIAVYAPHKPHC